MATTMRAQGWEGCATARAELTCVQSLSWGLRSESAIGCEKGAGGGWGGRAYTLAANANNRPIGIPVRRSEQVGRWNMNDET